MPQELNRGEALRSELAALIEILEEQRDIQSSLLSLSERKVKTITAGDASSLQGIVEEEKEALSSIKAVEKKQSQCVGRIASLLGLPVADMRMSLILTKAEGTTRERLERLRAELSELVEKQMKCNELNMKLLKMNMDYVQFLINATSRQQAGPTYGSGGLRQSAGGGRNLLDRKV